MRCANETVMNVRMRIAMHLMNRNELCSILSVYPLLAGSCLLCIEACVARIRRLPKEDMMDANDLTPIVTRSNDGV